MIYNHANKMLIILQIISSVFNFKIIAYSSLSCMFYCSFISLNLSFINAIKYYQLLFFLMKHVFNIEINRIDFQ